MTFLSWTILAFVAFFLWMYINFLRNPTVPKPAKIVITILSIAFGGCVYFASGSAQAASTYSYLPDPNQTPGVVASTSVEEVCEPGYPERARHVTERTKKQVYSNYHVDQNQCVGGCKIDHLIPLSIGGSNDIHNLWPHEYGAERNVFMKTRLETRLRKEVCHNHLNITEAQQCIATDWPKCFDRFYPGVFKHD